MTLHFIKMHGIGNDYIYLDGFSASEAVAAALADPQHYTLRLADRHKSVGGDGLVFILPSAVADAHMRMFNADGSEGLMCGNAIRSVGKYLYEQGYVPADHRTLTVETASGIKQLLLTVEGGTVVAVQVDMGPAVVADAPMTVEAHGKDWTLWPVSTGNPHAVTFIQDAESVDAARTGAAISGHFPGGVNVEFATLVDSCILRMRVCERGTGVTLACGTGACATAAAAVATGRCPLDTDITVRLDGGNLTVRITPDGRALMTGGAEVAFEGRVEI